VAAAAAAAARVEMAASAVSAVQPVGTAAVVPPPASRVVAAAAGAASPRRRSMCPHAGLFHLLHRPVPGPQGRGRGAGGSSSSGSVYHLVPARAASGGSACCCGTWAVGVVRVRRRPRVVLSYTGRQHARSALVSAALAMLAAETAGVVTPPAARAVAAEVRARCLFPAPSRVLMVLARRARP